MLIIVTQKSFFMEPCCESNNSDENTVQAPFLQPLWKLALEYDYYTKSPLFLVFVGVGSFFLFNIPFTIFDFIGKEWRWVKKYRIHPETELTWSMARHAIVLILWNQFLYILPVSIAQWVWAPENDLPALAPPLWLFLWEVFASLVIYDAELFIWHIIHHRSRFLYRHVHSIHHRPTVVHCWVSQYVHPWELISVGIIGTQSPWVVQAHPLSSWSFMVLNAFLGVETHSGYDFPIMLHRWFPFFGGTPKHEMHHQKPLVNFQPYFTWFDRILSTECPGDQAGGVKPKALLAREEEKKSK